MGCGGSKQQQEEDPATRTTAGATSKKKSSSSERAPSNQPSNQDHQQSDAMMGVGPGAPAPASSVENNTNGGDNLEQQQRQEDPPRRVSPKLTTTAAPAAVDTRSKKPSSEPCALDVVGGNTLKGGIYVPTVEERAQKRSEEERSGVYEGQGTLWRLHKQDPSFLPLTYFMVVDQKMMFEQCSEDVAFVKEINEEYAKTGRQQLAAIRTALDDGQYKVVFAEAHSLKGSSANLGVQRVTAVALEVELLGRVLSDAAEDSGDRRGMLSYCMSVLEHQFTLYEELFPTLVWE
eukprot:PhM_4_TR7266/c0_g1_i1/m.39278